METVHVALESQKFSLRKLMVSHDLLRLTVTNQIAFDQRDSSSILNFERWTVVTRRWFPNWKPQIP